MEFEEKAGIKRLSHIDNKEELSINVDYSFPKLYRQYARWNIKKITKRDKKHLNSFGPVQIPSRQKGLYVIYDRDGEVLYVGINNDNSENSSLYTRLNSQLENSRFKDYIYRIDTYLFNDPEERDTYEFLLINTLFPVFNKDKTLYKSKKKEEEYKKKPCFYNEALLTSIERTAFFENIAPAYILLQTYWDQLNETSPNNHWDWINRESNNWVTLIANRNDISERQVFEDAYQYIRLVDEVGEEDITSEELENNIFTSWNLKWLY
ncbi:hypothetical protein [Sporosarcina sp. Marseille-Q4943]|uniref:hypothetical protein n=1 Tax=Sporosarcina sp. Marseille-Q4943 TaxID=2942204 RepID=UPI00208DAE73|nr:hypothetical protein [Sporosarcina sp. Marseille-Q4943]